MKIAMMQPTFLPWQGMFELIYNCDKFIFLDDFQYCPRSHHTRNKLFVAKDNVGFYSVNVCKNESQKVNLNETYLVLDTQWKNDILKRINFVYAKTPFYNKYYSIIKNWLLTNHKTLADLNISCIKDICNILGIKKQFLYSQNYTKATHSKATRTERICELLKWGGAEHYIFKCFWLF